MTPFVGSSSREYAKISGQVIILYDITIPLGEIKLLLAASASCRNCVEVVLQQDGITQLRNGAVGIHIIGIARMSSKNIGGGDP